VHPPPPQEGQRAQKKCGADYDGRTTAKNDPRPNKDDPQDDDSWRSKVFTFEEYLDLPEYHNIFCRM
jgi:hypothetical protein